MLVGFGKTKMQQEVLEPATVTKIPKADQPTHEKNELENRKMVEHARDFFFF